MDRFMLFHELVRSRRSIRRWTDEPVPRADLEQMLDCARLAPSDTNAQPWHFTVTTNRVRIQQLEQATHARFRELEQAMASADHKEAARKLRVFEKYAATFGSAPALILVSGEPYDSRFMREVFTKMLTPEAQAQLSHDESIKSTSLASMNLLLAAHALGYGAVPMTGPVLAIPEYLQTAFQVPAPFEPHLLIAVGHPQAANPPAVPRKSLESVVQWID
ncbi:MAG TPA: nitroreductase family protein [Symbiobacteriaceae bacterium]|nr:nitroreductase family protein [Symbiobacteriaceae bacterium]